MQDDAAQNLHREVPQAEHAVGRLSAGGEGLRQNVVERCAAGQPLFKLVGFFPQFIIRQGFILILQRQYRLLQGEDALNFLCTVVPKDFR